MTHYLFFNRSQNKRRFSVNVYELHFNIQIEQGGKASGKIPRSSKDNATRTDPEMDHGYVSEIQRGYCSRLA